MLFSFSPLSLIAALILIGFSVYKFIVHPAFISPLSKIPNAHPTAPFSAAWILWKRYTMQNNRTVHAAHQKHGPIVRLGPNELSVNCVDGGIRTIYAGGFEKHDWYPRLFPSYGVINMFSQPHHKPHSERKRLVSNIYSKSYVQTSEQLAANSLTLLSKRFLPFLQAVAGAGTALDVHDMNNGFTTDFMSAYQFGIDVSTKFSIDPEARKHFLHMYHGRRDFEFHKQELPNFTKFCKFLGIPWVPKFVDRYNDEIERWGLGLCDAACRNLKGSHPCGSEPVVYKQLTLALRKQNEMNAKKIAASSPVLDESAQRLNVASDMLDQLGAGHETSAVCLTYLYWELSKRPELQKLLREELLSLDPPILWPNAPEQAFELPSPKTIDSLPVLHAVLMETLRLHAPIPGTEPRITPSTPTTLVGYTNIPPNVRVSAQAYSLHRNPNVFPEPEQWKFERWMKPADSEELREMHRWFWAFGSGGRMCIGSNLAMQEIKLLVAAIYSNYKSGIVNDDGIEQIDVYTTRPKSNKLILKFEFAQNPNQADL